MSNKINRRRFVQTSGAVTGLAGFSGLASAHDREHGIESNIDVNVETVTSNGTQYTASIAHNLETGEKNGTILSVEDSSNQSAGEFEPLASDSTQPYEISNAVLERLDESAFENATSTGNTSRVRTADASSSSNGLWGQLRDASNASAGSNTVRIQKEEELLVHVAKEIKAGVKDSIDQLGAYYLKSAADRDCDYFKNDTHHQLGVCIGYEQVLAEYTEAAISGILGALIGSVGGIKGAFVGGLVGGVAGKAVGDLKDSTDLTLILCDKDNCSFFGYGPCKPEIDVFVSGYWFDVNRELLHVPTPNVKPPQNHVPGSHLDMFPTPDEGYYEIFYISD
ncbi:twin-arginine translocation signal domain-containing protein [Natrinema halophilum]|uniref:Uncharacterized protein n=1 Tax=Natrinema halophilum TaxID=1699371 RepID=A0A7D5KZP9_9EURY|nr:twin-arginine translocation signal domain-containing protein [Natrinema halophilum]QLG49780.1 twin-arginine translocation signal domain-containing protein [Natrinema halophilum]